MARFILVYHGGGMPETPEAQASAMKEWGDWMGGLGAAIADPGNPVGLSKTVTPQGITDDGGSNPVSGYTVLEAADMDAALAMAGGCPILGHGGTIEVAPIVEM